MSEDLKKIVKKHVNSIKNTSLFQGLPVADLVKFLVNCKHNELKEGETIFKEGEPSLSMAIILTGRVDIFKDKSRVCSLESPALIGEIGLFAEEPRNATVKSVYDSISLTITQEDLNSFFLREPKMAHTIYRNIILSLRNKINNDNQQILSLQEDLGLTEKEVLKLRVSLEEKEKLEKANSAIKIRRDIPPANDRPLSAGQKNVHAATSNRKLSFMNILKTKKSKEAPKRPKFSLKKKRDILPSNARLSRNSRKSLRIAITNQQHCYIMVGKTTIIVKDLSLGGISVDLSSVETDINKDWVEGDRIQGEIFFQGQNSFPFYGIIRALYPNSCGIQFHKLSQIQENTIAKTVNDLQMVGQVV